MYLMCELPSPYPQSSSHRGICAPGTSFPLIQNMGWEEAGGEKVRWVGRSQSLTPHHAPAPSIVSGT